MALKDPAKRVWAKVDRNGPVSEHRPDLGCCWLWQGQTRGGYGTLTVDGKVIGTHRFVYELLVGPIPGGLHLDHLCRVPRCVNPAHLEPVTRRENILRGIGPTAENARKSHCPQGHPYTDDNVFISRQGDRRCRTCMRNRRRAQTQKWKEQDLPLRRAQRFCEVCGREFFNRRAARVHMTAVHGGWSAENRRRYRAKDQAS